MKHIVGKMGRYFVGNAEPNVSTFVRFIPKLARSEPVAWRYKGMMESTNFAPTI